MVQTNRVTILHWIKKIAQKNEAQRVNITEDLSNKQETANGLFKDLLEQNDIKANFWEYM